MTTEADVRGLLGEHIHLMNPQASNWLRCTCGWEKLIGWPDDHYAHHRAHLASLVFALVEQARAEGAREVAG
jgi:hypothetical protein